MRPRTDDPARADLRRALVLALAGLAWLAVTGCDVVDPEPVTCGRWQASPATVAATVEAPAGLRVELYADLCLTPTQARKAGWTPADPDPTGHPMTTHPEPPKATQSVPPLPPDVPRGTPAEMLAALLDLTDLPIYRLAEELGASHDTLARHLNTPQNDARPWPTWVKRIRKLQVTEKGTLILLHPKPTNDNP